MQSYLEKHSPLTSLASLDETPFARRQSKCRFIPELSSFDNILIKYQTSLFETKSEADLEFENQSPNSESNANIQDKQIINKKIFHQILKNNLLNAQPKSMILSGTCSTASSLTNLDEINEQYTIERKISSSPFKVLDAPNLQDDFYLNVVDWSLGNNLAVGLGQALYIWNFHTNEVKKLTEYFGRNLVSSVGWDIKGDLLSLGTKEGSVSLWDANKETTLRKFYEHNERVGAISLFGSLLLTGSKDRKIYLRDIRQKLAVVQKFETHSQEVCGLKWSPEGNYFASGGNDNKLCVFSPKTIYPLLKKHHKAAVKAIAWSKRKTGVLASGAGTADKTIKIWNINSKTLVKEKQTGSQVCNLAFSQYNDELISTHGFSNNEINIWNLKNFEKTKSLKGHLSRVLYLSMSPCGNYVVSGAGDETLRFWDLNYSKEETKSQILKNKSKDKKSYKISKFEPKIIR